MTHETYDPPERMVEKAGPGSAEAWAKDILLQAEMARRQGMSGPLTVGLDETPYLAALLEVATAARNLCAYHAPDIEPFARERLDALETAISGLHL